MESTSPAKKILVSGVKPTGRPHIGNYFGAIKQFIEMQHEYESYVFVANYHALTTAPDAQTMRQLTLDIAIDYLALGLDPKKTTIFLQSDVPEVTELSWVLGCVTTVPYLKRAHAYKDAVAKGAEAELSVGTFNYPVLMAADILIYGADVVPVGADQKQHIEFARDFAQKFNARYGEVFNIPEPIIVESVKTVPGVDGRKMSKSYDNTIPLFATDEEIRKIVMSIVTDSKRPEDKKDPEQDTIFLLHKLFAEEDQLREIERRYREGGMGYKESKEILIENIIRFIAPLRKRREEIASDTETVLAILKNGGEYARSRAKERMMEVRRAAGLSID